MPGKNKTQSQAQTQTQSQAQSPGHKSRHKPSYDRLCRIWWRAHTSPPQITWIMRTIQNLFIPGVLNFLWKIRCKEHLIRNILGDHNDPGSWSLMCNLSHQHMVQVEHIKNHEPGSLWAPKMFLIRCPIHLIFHKNLISMLCMKSFCMVCTVILLLIMTNRSHKLISIGWMNWFAVRIEVQKIVTQVPRTPMKMSCLVHCILPTQAICEGFKE